ncbi:isochorismate synthase [Oscillatoria sp. FACHB-1407]|uniref:isochorismate synthase n=1 Tax=Oscillatoria sp. FACHB-1407 TaxID=2692847 RepID=UPI001689F041|nr:isochorismate synthase [Oscillatoria sp. FACHB-1407]MBD2462242.1 isochorismate synthase [Oscillatoria sp. FACHB-1407]
MPVALHQTDLFQDRKHLYQFLCFCQQKSLEKNQPQIASISSEIECIDPLILLQEFSQTNQPHFYFEKGAQGEAIVALGEAIAFETEGRQRFFEVQQFIQSCSEQFITTHAINPPTVTPHFFCGFTFFDSCKASKSPFSVATVLLPQWQIIHQQNQTQLTANLRIHAQSNIENLTDTLWQKYQAICRLKRHNFTFVHKTSNYDSNWKISDTHRFGATVNAALKAIRARHLNKIVLAHAVDVVSHRPFQWLQSLHSLRHSYADCCVFSIHNGKGQTFIGASPERLLRIRDRKLITDALAGSAPRGKTVIEDAESAQRLLNSEKEQREHRVVVDFLTQQLAQLGLTPHFPSAPTLLSLSNIQHLHTPIHAVVPSHLHPLSVLAQLHPTPAVAGMPREIAGELIRQYERFERSLYAAPLGWVDAQGNAEFIVGIRSALIDGAHARLYAGAGIVAGSDPDREVAEVRLKLQALLQALI